MNWATLDRQLLTAISKIPEVRLSGFVVRQGLPGKDVTILRGRNYFGGWCVASEALVWVPGKPPWSAHSVGSVEEAVRHTLLLILQNLETFGVELGAVARC